MQNNNGYNPNGYNPNGYNQNPNNQNGYNPNGYNPNGYNPYGYNQYPRYGYNPYYRNGYRGPAYPYNAPDPQKIKDKKDISKVSMACGFSIIGFLVLSLIMGGIMRVIPGFLDLYENNPNFSNSFDMIIILVTLFVPFVIAFFALKKAKISGPLPFGKPYDSKDFLLLIPISLLICFAGSLLTSLLASFVDAAFGISFDMPEDTGNYSTPLGIVIAFIQTAFIPAFTEEFCIRGVVLQPLRKYGDYFAIITSSFVFAMLHGNMIQIPFAFVAGIAIGYAVIKTGTMWTGVVIHFINNAMSVAATVLTENMSESSGEIVTSAIYGTVLLIGIICLGLFIKKNPKPLNCLSKNGETRLRTSEKAKSFYLTVPMLIGIAILCFETYTFISK